MTISNGAASLTASELLELTSAYHLPTASEAYKAANTLIKSADKALSIAPKAYATIVTSGSSAKSGSSTNTGTVFTQASNSLALAEAYEMTHKSSYLTQAKNYLLSWAKTHQPNGDSVANAPFIKMIQAYDMLRDDFSSSEKAVMDKWLGKMADALIAQHAKDVAAHSDMAGNNHYSWALLEVGTIGAVLGNDTYTQYLTDNFLSHIGQNLRSIPGDPAHLGVDFQQRDALHYVAYNLEALSEAAVLLDRLAHLPGNPYAIHYNPFTVEVNGASIAQTLSALLPYASGEKQATHEFADSTNPNDATRIAKGDLSNVFDPSDALPTLAAADYFGDSLNAGGKNYNLAQLSAFILKSDGKSVISTTLPHSDFLLNDIIRPEDDVTNFIKAATKDGVQTLTATADSDVFQFYKHTGQTSLLHFGDDDMLTISSKIYTSAEQAAAHVDYRDGNAVLHLDGTSTLTLLGVDALKAADFQIFS